MKSDRVPQHPGFPALFVTYEAGNDFFFSGRTGAPWLAMACRAAIIIALGEMLTVLVLRAHDTLDVVAGVFAAFFASVVAHRVAPAIDALLR